MYVNKGLLINIVVQVLHDNSSSMIWSIGKLVSPCNPIKNDLVEPVVVEMSAFPAWTDAFDGAETKIRSQVKNARFNCFV